MGSPMTTPWQPTVKCCFAEWVLCDQLFHRPLSYSIYNRYRYAHAARQPSQLTLMVVCLRTQSWVTLLYNAWSAQPAVEELQQGVKYKGVQHSTCRSPIMAVEQSTIMPAYPQVAVWPCNALVCIWTWGYGSAIDRGYEYKRVWRWKMNIRKYKTQ